MMPTLGLGLIEGFYGHPWNWSQRQACATFLGDAGYRFYIYAPKSDAGLRSGWRNGLSGEHRDHLAELAAACRNVRLRFGIGLSPLGLQDEWDTAGRVALRGRLAELQDLGIEILCLLFDDMPVHGGRLAQIQAEICGYALECLDSVQLIMCPSFYSDDPVLERVFGTRPPQYWEQLGSLLPAACGVFWTGPQVCSSRLDAAAFEDIVRRLQRQPILWDNYPVNDGERSSRFLHLDAFRGRSVDLAHCIAAHAVNPMNQPTLSRIPLQTLPQLYREAEDYRPEQAFEAACRRCCNAVLASHLVEDLRLFQQQGLDGLGTVGRATLRQRYAVFDSPVAAEIIAWLDGAYAFDPACLTG